MDSLEEGETPRGDNGPAWQQQGRRAKNRGLGVEISFFVSNLPGGVSQEEVRRAMVQSRGCTLLERRRHPFGFVRFRDVSDAWWLDKMKLGSNVLRDNIAKFAKSNEFLFQRQAPPRPESTVREGPKSHADSFMGVEFVKGKRQPGLGALQETKCVDSGKDEVKNGDEEWSVDKTWTSIRQSEGTEIPSPLLCWPQT
ncbi:hypothetical protein L1987_79595 [Smallanthus sonchifolius]|uniref:Uncharacterized protein n=1 Tax=Smallanthus sonchifolius TaxID=185202 RepID=A0ACB8YKD4_9ASTR|nr:hypothetical protein L1987_79595 [Smallanthus sonchifolius]